MRTAGRAFGLIRDGVWAAFAPVPVLMYFVGVFVGWAVFR